MAIYPKAAYRPLSYGSRTGMARFDVVSYHTMVGTLSSTDSMFRGHGYNDGTFSHFGVGYDGMVYQWCDTAYRAAANLDGNARIISIECADYGTGFPTWNTNDGSAVPAFTDAQLTALIELTKWICDTHGIPRTEALTSLPSSRGLGWHRKGVESSPPYRSGYRVQGGEHWSTSVGKVCFPVDTTEALTDRGWVGIGDVSADDLVASWSMDSGVVSFAPAALVETHSASVIKVGQFESTANHEWVVRDQNADVRCSCGYTGTRRGVRNHAGHGTRRGEAHEVVRTAAWKKMPAEQVTHRAVLPGAVNADLPGLEISDDHLRLLVWAQGDGHYMTDSRSSTLRNYGVEWHLSKARKVERLTQLLVRLGVPYTCRTRRDGTSAVRVYGEPAREWITNYLPEKKFTWDLLEMSATQSDAFLDELSHVDGSAELASYFTMDKVCADVVQAVATLNGRRTSLRTDDYGLHWVRFLQRECRVNSEQGSRITDVACLTTVDGTLIIRQHGYVVVSGNCPGDKRIVQLQTIVIPAIKGNSTIPAPIPPAKDDDMKFPYKLYRNNTTVATDVTTLDEAGQESLGTPGSWIPMPNADYVGLAVTMGLIESMNCEPFGTDKAGYPPNVYNWIRNVFLSSEANDNLSLADLTAIKNTLNTS